MIHFRAQPQSFRMSHPASKTQNRVATNRFRETSVVFGPCQQRAVYVNRRQERFLVLYQDDI